MTNVKPSELNYDSYDPARYDDEIVRSIPGHAALHCELATVLRRDFSGRRLRVLELGIGTGLTAEVIIRHSDIEHYTGIDFSEKMLAGAAERLQPVKSDLVLGDYAQMEFPASYDLVVSVIGIHHQASDQEKQALFHKIRTATADLGAFLFGDLVTHRDARKAAVCEAKHYHFLVEQAQSEESLADWAFHHRCLNFLSPIESQIEWLREAGFPRAEVIFEKFNTALVYAR